MKFRKPIWKKNKTYKQPYRKSRAFDKSCRNHGDCPYCRDGRLHFDRSRRWLADNEIRQFLNGEF
jgi:hypothetical protein